MLKKSVDKKEDSTISRQEIRNLRYDSIKTKSEIAKQIYDIFVEYIVAIFNISTPALVRFNSYNYLENENFKNHKFETEIFMEGRQRICLINLIRNMQKCEYDNALRELMDIVIMYGGNQNISINEMILYITLYGYIDDEKANDQN